MNWKRWVNPFLWVRDRKVQKVIQRTLTNGPTTLDPGECLAVKNWAEDYARQASAKQRYLDKQKAHRPGCSMSHIPIVFASCCCDRPTKQDESK